MDSIERLLLSTLMQKKSLITWISLYFVYIMVTLAAPMFVTKALRNNNSIFARIFEGTIPRTRETEREKRECRGRDLPLSLALSLSLSPTKTTGRESPSSSEDDDVFVVIENSFILKIIDVFMKWERFLDWILGSFLKFAHIEKSKLSPCYFEHL